MAIRICVGPYVVDKQGGLQQVLVTYHCLLEGLTLFWFKYAQSSHTSQLDDSVTPGNVETWPAAKSTDTFKTLAATSLLSLSLPSSHARYHVIRYFLEGLPPQLSINRLVSSLLHPAWSKLHRVSSNHQTLLNKLKQSCLVNHPWTMSVWRESHHSKRSWPFASPPCTGKWWKALNLWVVSPFFSSPSTLKLIGAMAAIEKMRYADCWVEQPRGFRSENSSSASKSSELSTLICFFGISKFEKMFLRKPAS